jgi:aconitate hydratase
MGVLPLEFAKGVSRKTLSFTGSEKITILEMNMITPNKIMQCKINQENLSYNIDLTCRIDTLKELDYFKAGGILQYVLNTMIAKVS